MRNASRLEGRRNILGAHRLSSWFETHCSRNAPHHEGPGASIRHGLPRRFASRNDENLLSQRFLQIGDEIVAILNTDREAHQPIINP